MSAAADSSRRLQRLAQILAESNGAPASTTGWENDPAEFHLGCVPLERISLLTSELTRGEATTVDDIDHLVLRLLLNEYTASVGRLRATARLTEQRIADAAVPIQEMRRRIRLRKKHAEGARRTRSWSIST
jgi:hypothetical protein